MQAHTAALPGWLLCDGSAISRTDYAGLFATISTAYGVGDGSTTFNIPNFTSFFPMGNTPGATGGANTDDLSHVHSVNPPATTTGAPSATVSATAIGGSAASPTHTHSVDIAAFDSATGGNASHDNRPALTGVAFYIYAGSGI